MTEKQITLDRMQKELREMPSSPQRLELCQEFVALADREKARAQQISGRYDLAWAYATAGDPAKALPVCAEFLQMQEETPNTSGKPHLEAVLAVNIAVWPATWPAICLRSHWSSATPCLRSSAGRCGPTAWGSACGSPMRGRWRL